MRRESSTVVVLVGEVSSAMLAEVAGTAGGPAQAASLLDTLRSLEHGPWWPPLDELLDAARHFFAGDLAVPRQAPG